MTYKVQKNKIADILLDFYDEYHSNEINRPMIPSIYAGKILNSLQEESVNEEWIEELTTKLDSLSKEDFKKVFEKYAVDFNEEPTSEGLEKAANEWNAKASFTPFYMALDANGKPNGVRQSYTTHAESFKAGAKWQKQKQKDSMLVSEELEDACKQLAENARKHKAETSSPFFSQTDYIQGVMDGVKWAERKTQKK